MGSPTLGAEPGAAASLAGTPAGEPPHDLLGTISSWVLKTTAAGPAELSSPPHSLSRSGMLSALSSCSLERDAGEGCEWRTEDLFLLMGKGGVMAGAGIPKGTSDVFGFELGPLLLVSGGFRREMIDVMLDGDSTICGRRALASLWLSLQELKLRLSDLMAASLGWQRLPEVMLPDDRRPVGGLELTDKNGDAPALAVGRSELARFSKDLILCFTEKNEVDSRGQFCSW